MILVSFSVLVVIFLDFVSSVSGSLSTNVTYIGLIFADAKLVLMVTLRF